MSFSKCLGCYLSLQSDQNSGYHPACSKKLFGTTTPPLVDFGADQLEHLAIKSLSQHLGITGVQPKISVHIDKHEHDLKGVVPQLVETRS